MAPKKKKDQKGSKSPKGQRKARRRKSAGERPKHPPKDLVNHRQMHALSKPLRVRILAIFCERIASPKEISDELDEGLSQVSYHVKVLKACRLIVEVHKVPRRGTVKHFYQAAVPTLIPPSVWKHLPPSVRESISLNILQHFFDDASASTEAGVFDNSPGELSWTPLILDSLGVEELGQLTRGFLDSVLELQANASKRLSKGNRKATGVTSATAFLASFQSARSPGSEGASAARGVRRHVIRSDRD